MRGLGLGSRGRGFGGSGRLLRSLRRAAGRLLVADDLVGNRDAGGRANLLGVGYGLGLGGLVAGRGQAACDTAQEIGILADTLDVELSAASNRTTGGELGDTARSAGWDGSLGGGKAGEENEREDGGLHLE